MVGLYFFKAYQQYSARKYIDHEKLIVSVWMFTIEALFCPGNRY
jgi:hypothetical protein